MNPNRFLLAGWIVTIAAAGTAAQDASPSAPQPTRWNAPASTIDVDSAAEAAARESFPLLDSRGSGGGPSVSPAGESKAAFASPTVTVTSSLAIVLGLFAAMIWMTRRFGSRSAAGGVIPSEVMQSLGSTALDTRTRVTLLRCGNRILVLAQTQNDVQRLAEITDPEEVRALTASCHGDAKHSFVSTLRSIEQEPVPPGFTGESIPQVPPRKRSRLFATA